MSVGLRLAVVVILNLQLINAVTFGTTTVAPHVTTKDEGGPTEALGPVLHRMSERLAAMQALDEQQLRRLEMLEYKLTRMEVQQQERTDSLRSDLREVSRRLQQVDSGVTKMEATMEAVKVDTLGLRKTQETVRSYSVASGDNEDTKRGVVTTALHALRGTLATLQRDVNIVRSNLTMLHNISSSVTGLRSQCFTKQYLTTALNDLKRVTRPIVTTQDIVAQSCATQRDTTLPHDCRDVRRNKNHTSGIFKIWPPGAAQAFYVQCELETRGGGWTVLQHRSEGAVDFYRDWLDYKHGFGNLAGEFWLGLEKIHLLTNVQVNELLIELKDFDDMEAFAYYQAFAVGSEAEGYPITILGSYTGDAGDSLSYHAGHKFSTLDQDNDAWPDGNCAEAHTGGWWYSACDNANLNGRYFNGELPPEYEYQGVYWQDWHGPSYSLRSSRVSVRPYQEKLVEKATESSDDQTTAKSQARRKEGGWGG